MNYEKRSDIHLAGLAKQNDNLAFAVLWRRHYQKTLLIAASFVRNEADAQDVAQDAWVKAWTHMASFDDNAEFAPWMAGIVRNQSLMRLRSARRQRTVALDISHPNGDYSTWELQVAGPDPEQELVSAETLRLLRGHLAKIPRLLREPIEAAYLEGFPLAVAAKRLSITEPTLKSRLRRGKAELRLRIISHPYNVPVQTGGDDFHGCQTANGWVPRASWSLAALPSSWELPGLDRTSRRASSPSRADSAGPPGRSRPREASELVTCAGGTQHR